MRNRTYCTRAGRHERAARPAQAATVGARASCALPAAVCARRARASDRLNAILVPIASSADAARAALRAIALYRASPAIVHLLNVQHPLPRHVARFFPRNDLRAFHADAGMAVLAPAIRALDAAAVPHEDHVVVGHAAEAIVEFAARHDCGDIVLDTPLTGVRSLLHAGSISSQVRHLLRDAGGGDAAGVGPAR